MKRLAYSAGKASLVALLRCTGLLRLFRWLNRNRLIVLTYHSVLPSEIDIEDYEARNVVTQEMFAWQMRYLAKHYRCLPLAQAVQQLGGDGALPQYAVAVTFDDGFQNNLRYALPVLSEYRVPVTIFVTTGHVGHGTRLLWTERVGRLLGRAKPPLTVTLPGEPMPLTLSLQTAGQRAGAIAIALKWLKSMPSDRRECAIDELDRRLRALDVGPGGSSEPNPERYRFLTWSEVRALARQGVTIGSHTISHAILTSLDDDRRVEEVVESKQTIEQHLGTPCTLFGYPNGTQDDFDDRDKANLRRAGYVAAVAQMTGVNDRDTDRFALRRLNIGRGHTPALFIAQVSGLWPWLRSVTAPWAHAVGRTDTSARRANG
jgi:peptidoglycan/xylan/chitin deacetylase (PgdA/CDA1 family)